MKKNLSLLRLKILILSVFITNLIFAEQVVDELESGRKKLISILCSDETGINGYTKKNIKYAETQNLPHDLNIAQIAKFFDCKTLIGQSFIIETLKYPVSTQDLNLVVKRRQDIIRTLVENGELRAEIDKLLEEAKQEEQVVIELLSEFFKGKTCPELKQLEIIKQQSPFMAPLTEWFLLNPTGKTISTTINTVSLASATAGTVLFARLSYILAKNKADYSGSAFMTAYMGVISGLLSYQFYKDYSYGAEKRLKLHSLNRLINIAEKFDNFSRKFTFNTQFSMGRMINVNSLHLVDKLKSSRYKDKKTIFFALPLVHTFLYEVFQKEKYLSEVFACIAEMDAYNAIANKFIKSKNEKNKFCFVSFLEEPKPVVKAQSFWNVLVKDAVSSNISENRHIILTGPNAGGKTTAIRAILQNIILGQTYGIAAAESFDFTMFDIIYSYLNISDDLINGLSLFASEVKRAQEVLQKIKSLDPKKKFFFALDELFTGTAAEEGEKCAFEFVKRISEFKGVQFIYATHFNKLKQLGKDNEFCINYKVDAPTKNKEGKLVYPFTLSLGANDTNVAMELAKEANLFS